MVRVRAASKNNRLYAQLISLFVAIALMIAGSISFAKAHDGPESVADLAENVLDAVVNISIIQGGNTARPRRNTRPDDEPDLPKAPEDSPFEEFFDDFFKKQQQPGEGNRGRRARGQGSGFVIDPEGVIVTNNHVIEGASEIIIDFNDGSKLNAELVGTDAKTDLAVLRVKADKPLPYVKLGSSDDARVGDWVMVIGNPFGLNSSVSVGIISARNRDIQSGPYDNYIQTDAAINQGNSGGPLFDKNGDVIGVNTAIFSPSGGGSVGIGFAVPSDTARSVVSQLLEFGETRRGWLGVNILHVTDELAESLALGKARGAMVSAVTAAGPAEKAGLLSGDVVIKFDGRNVRVMRDLPRMVADTPVGKEVDVTVFRDGKEVDLKVNLGRLDEDEKVASADESKTDEKPKEVTPEDGAVLQLGMSFEQLDDGLREKLKIAKTVEGVVISSIQSGSLAEEKGVEVGDVVRELSQTEIKNPEDVKARLAALKEADRRAALFLLENKEGELRLVAIRLDD
ncbi:MAG: Do family serine endopeptidase [Hyphomicrobiales bacterium]